MRVSQQLSRISMMTYLPIQSYNFCKNENEHHGHENLRLVHISSNTLRVFGQYYVSAFGGQHSQNRQQLQ